MPDTYPGYADVEDFDIDAPENAGRMTIRKAVENARILSNGRGEKPKAGTSAAKASRAAAKPAKRARKSPPAEPAKASPDDDFRVLAAAEPEAEVEGEGGTPVQASGTTDKLETNKSAHGGGPSEPSNSFDFVDEINKDYALALVGSKAVVVRTPSAADLSDRNLFLGVYDFKTWFRNKAVEYRDASGKMRNSTAGEAWLSDPRRRQYSGVEFYPDPDNKSGKTGFLNLWRGFSCEPKYKINGHAIYDDHILTNVCRGDKHLFHYLFGYLAHMVQKPRERLGVAIILRGKEGTGKTCIFDHVGALFPRHYLVVTQKEHVSGHFNQHMAECLLLLADEAFWAGDKAGLFNALH